MQPENQSPQQPPAPSTPPQAPAPAPQPNVVLDPNGNPIPPLTPKQKVKYSIVAVIVIAFIVGVIALFVSMGNANNAENARINDLKNNGTKVIGTANGEVHEYNDRSKRGGISVRYKAIYEYYEQDQDSSNPDEEPFTAIGEKLYDTEEEVQAIKGQKADVYYNGKGGDYVEDDK